MRLTSLINRLSRIVTILTVLAVNIQGEPSQFESPIFGIHTARTETGVARAQGTSLILGPDARVRFDLGKAYGMRNGIIRVVFTPPDIKTLKTPLHSQRAECLCAFKVHIGRLVTELSDRGIRVYLQDRTHARTDTIVAEKLMDMTPAGIQTSLDISIEDRICTIIIEGDTMASCAVNEYDFSLIHLATFGHAFTVHEFSLHPIERPMMVTEPLTSSILLDAIYYPSRFNSRGGLPQHHFITWKGGRASMQALIETRAPDSIVHDALIAAGIKPGNNLTLDTWNKRRSTASTEPDKKADGDPLTISIIYGGREFSAAEVLTDLNRNAFDFRFAGNKAFIPVWNSGCVACLQSCPGSKIANRTYTMRDLEQKKVSFTPGTGLPFSDGDPVRVRIKPARP